MMTEAATPAAQALDQVHSLLDQAEATDSLGRRLPDRSWTPQNQRKFLQYVADGNTAEYATWMLGLSVQGAYAFRRTARGAAFALGWRAANLIAREAIADQLMERALKGQTETITRADGSEVTKLRYDNRLAMNLLRRLDRQAEEATGADAAAARVVANEFDAYLDLVEKDGGPARAGLFLARRSPASAGLDGEALDLEPILTLAAADRFARTGAGVAAEVDIADLDPARRGDWTGEQWARAEAAGLVALAPAKPVSAPKPTQSVSPPEEELDPVWEHDDFGWVTEAPPPEGFDGHEEHEYGHEEYFRTLSEAEEEVWLAPIVRQREEQRLERAAEWQAFLARRRAASANAAPQCASSTQSRRTDLTANSTSTAASA